MLFLVRFYVRCFWVVLVWIILGIVEICLDGYVLVYWVLGWLKKMKNYLLLKVVGLNVSIFMSRIVLENVII